jgi:hypothetical protein
VLSVEQNVSRRPAGRDRQIDAVGQDQIGLRQCQAGDGVWQRGLCPTGKKRRLGRFAGDRAARQEEHQRLDGEPQLEQRAPAGGRAERPENELPTGDVEAHRHQRGKQHQRQRPAHLADEAERQGEVVPMDEA